MRLIDADALVETFAKVLHRHDSSAAEMRYGFVKKVIDNATTIDHEPERHGRWEITPTYGILVCSACRDCYIDEDWTAGKKWSFCPECGADMRGGQKADE